ncbi:cytochrome P450 [Coprinopsis sp. MPI-PUGE-AT-0042]|nr:cytochrome P450 [Coprinopsis sp. MPI-PUGE-AT-0042]
MAISGIHLAICSTAVVSCIVLLLRRKQRELPYPPTPKGIPILGNALQIPFHESWLAFQQMSRELDSDIIHLNAAGESLIVLNSVADARELLGKRSAKYSSRRHAIMANELMGWGWLMSGLPYGQAWRDRRKLFQKIFDRHSNMEMVEERTTQYAYRMIGQLLEAPDDFQEHIRHLVGGLAFSLAYGIPTQPRNDPYIRLAEQSIDPAGRAVVPGAYLVDVLPFLKYIPEWVPGAGFKRDAREWKEMMQRYRDGPFEAAELLITNGKALPSLTSLALAEERPQGMDERRKEVIKDTAGMFFTAGFDTTRSTLTYFILAMLHFPQVQARAQQEVDSVLGQNGTSLPSFSDRERMPYVSALVEELLRWWPAVALGVPHYTTSSDNYRGYFIPEKAIVIANVWAMLHDEEDYPNPHLFMPERYLDADGKFDGNTAVPLPSTIAFGFGRRICPGLHIATTIVWMTVASILATFNISPSRNKDGLDTEPLPDVTCQPGLVAFPKPFKCAFEPRPNGVERISRVSQPST